MTVSDKKKIYDCTTCPYPRYKDGSVIGALAAIKPLVLPGVGKKTLVYVIKTSVL